MIHDALNAAVQEIAAKQLPEVVGFQFNAANRIFLVGLKHGAWIENVERSKERLELLQEISFQIYEGTRRTLERYLPGKKWKYDWHIDPNGTFGLGATVMSFRWSDA
jgi:hypothetical protein